MITQYEEIENIVIGSILIDRNVIDVALTNLIPIDFEIPANHDIFNSVMRLYSNGRPIDMVTVIQDMKANKEHDQLQHILKVTNLVGSTANFEAHVMILKNKSIKRQLSYLGQKLISDATKEEIEATDQTLELIENANNILSRIDIKKVITFPELVMKTIDESLSRKDNDKLGLLSGFEKFDNITSGFCAPDFSMLAAGPGEGKSSWALNAAKHISLNGEEVLYFSLEMKAYQLVWKLLSDELNIPVMDVRKGRFDASHAIKTNLVKAKLNIYDKGGVTIDEVVSISKTKKKEKDIKIIIIDYIQLINVGNYKRKINNRTDEVTVISNKLKQLAMELNIPILALSQLSRDKTRRRYGNHDLRDSGSLEQDADNIYFIYRPVEHQMDIYEIGSETIQCNEQTAIFSITKNRLGVTGEFEMRFNGMCSRFEDLNYKPIKEIQSYNDESKINGFKPNLQEEIPF